jgi:hypothetical protein
MMEQPAMKPDNNDKNIKHVLKRLTPSKDCHEVAAHSDARQYKNGPVYVSRHGRMLMNGQTQSGTHKNNTAIDKEVDPNRKWTMVYCDRTKIQCRCRRCLTEIL